METTEHIVESYVRFVKKWFTISNIKAKGGKEIDILAVDKDGLNYCPMNQEFINFHFHCLLNWLYMVASLSKNHVIFSNGANLFRLNIK